MIRFHPIERRKGLTAQSFQTEYLANHSPVVIQDFMNHWPAKDKWTPAYLREHYGNTQVPVISPRYSQSGRNYMKAEKHLSLSEYLQLLEAGPMEYRIFLFNLFRRIPKLTQDFNYPTLMYGWVKSFPFLFFGGQGTVTGLHYDIDYSHVFLNQIHGKKRVVLFPPEMSAFLYQHPYTVASFVNINDPDYDRYPALRFLEGLEVELQPGETLFIPSGWWHYIEYVDGGYSMSLRAFENNWQKIKGWYQILKQIILDRGLNYVLGYRWRILKDQIAQRNAEQAMQHRGLLHH